MLDRGRIEFFADLLQDFFACTTFVVHDPYLDDFMGDKTAVDFTGNGWRQASGANSYDGFEGMSAGFERPTLERREL